MVKGLFSTSKLPAQKSALCWNSWISERSCRPPAYWSPNLVKLNFGTQCKAKFRPRSSAALLCTRRCWPWKYSYFRLLRLWGERNSCSLCSFQTICSRLTEKIYPQEIMNFLEFWAHFATETASAWAHAEFLANFWPDVNSGRLQAFILDPTCHDRCIFLGGVWNKPDFALSILFI